MSEARRRPRRHGRLLRLATALLLAAGLAAFAGAFVPAVSLFAHFHPHYALAWAVLLPVLAASPRARASFWRPGRVAAAGAVLLVGHAAVVGALWWPREEPFFEDPDPLTVVWANVMHDNASLAALHRMVADDPPDVVALAEVRDEAALDLPGYPHELRDTRHDLRLHSRHPLERRRLELTGEGGRNVLVADCLVGRRRVTLMVAHARQPFYAVHSDELRVLAGLAAAREHVILVGDLNTTPWAAEFRSLLADGGLRHARAGRGLLTTWAPPVSGLRWLSLPIDHVLYKGDVALAAHRRLPWTASDHRPLESRFLLGMKRRFRPPGGD